MSASATATTAAAGFVRRRPLLSYGVLACVLSWAWWVPLLVAGQSVRQGVGWPTQLPGWWRNLTGGAEVSVRLRGAAWHGWAEVLESGTPAFQPALERYLRRFPRAAAAASSSPALVPVALVPAGADPVPDPVRTAAGVSTPPRRTAS